MYNRVEYPYGRGHRAPSCCLSRRPGPRVPGLLLVTAVAAGAARVGLLEPLVGERTAHQLGTLAKRDCPRILRPTNSTLGNQGREGLEARRSRFGSP